MLQSQSKGRGGSDVPSHADGLLWCRLGFSLLLLLFFSARMCVCVCFLKIARGMGLALARGSETQGQGCACARSRTAQAGALAEALGTAPPPFARRLRLRRAPCGSPPSRPPPPGLQLGPRWLASSPRHASGLALADNFEYFMGRSQYQSQAPRYLHACSDGLHREIFQ